MDNIFKSWVPEWLIKIILFSGLMPSMVLFFLPGANINVTAGYYGCQPTDVQFLIILFYAGFVGFYILERRFFLYFQNKQYYIIFHLLQILNCYLLYAIEDITWIYPLRFVEGMLFASAVNLSISMIFLRLHSEKAKEGSYAVFFGMLLCSSPFNTFVTADFIDSFNFDLIYFYAALTFLPGLILIALTMQSIPKLRPFPLYSLDWASFIFYGIFIICFGYIMVYGQEMYWFTHERILSVSLVAIVCLVILLLRQQVIKRQYIHFGIFRSKNLLLGLLILFTMYIERFSLSITNQYFSQILSLDPIHLSYIQWFNITGIVIGVLVSLKWILVQKSVKRIWLIGFVSLLVFHQIMYFSFETDGNDYYFWFPLILHGFGVGLIMVPTILFVISSVKSKYGVSAAAVCLAIRYFGYTCNIGLQNFFKLYESSLHQQSFGDHTQLSNPIFQQYINDESAFLLENGLNHAQHTAALKIISERVKLQSFLRYAMDYYELMSLIAIGIIILVIFIPSLNAMYNKFKKNILAPT